METTASLRLTELLMKEHRLIERALVVLARLCAHLRRGGGLPAGDARELLRFIREYADAFHHAKEEDVLFPWMSARSPQVEAGPIAVMLADHCEARLLVAEMLAAVESGDGDRLVASGEPYALLLARHIWKEDNVLYPMANSLAGGTAGLYDPAADPERDSEAIEAEFHAVIEGLEEKAEAWPPEDVRWPEGCH